MADVIQSYGLFWRESDVLWGVGSKPGALYGVPVRRRSSELIDFREQVGIYVLYAGHEMVYVGQTGSGNQKLLRRLRKHLKDNLAGRWDTFSWFGMRRVLQKGELSKVNQRAGSQLGKALNLVEAVLIAAAEPNLNRQGGRFGKRVVRYIQRRDPRLDKTQAEMIKEIWRRDLAE